MWALNLTFKSLQRSNSIHFWLQSSDDVAGVRCTWRSSGWYSDGSALHWGTVLSCEKFDSWHPDWRQHSSVGDDTPLDPNCKALGDQEVVWMETSEWETTCSDSEGEWRPRWFHMDWGRASQTKDPFGKMHFTTCYRSMEGTEMPASMICIGIGGHCGSQWCFRTIVWSMPTQFSGGICNFPMAERLIFGTAYQCTNTVSQTWQRWSIKYGVPAWI